MEEHQCNTENFVPTVVPGISRCSSSSSASKSSTSLPQDTSDDTSSSPAQTRSDSTSIPASGNRLRDLPEWLEEFTEHLEDEGVFSTKGTHPQKTSQGSDSERPNKVVSRKHGFYVLLPKGQNCEICKRTCTLAGSALVMQYLEQKTLVT